MSQQGGGGASYLQKVEIQGGVRQLPLSTGDFPNVNRQEGGSVSWPGEEREAYMKTE